MLPLSDTPEQECQLTATIFDLLKIFFRTNYLNEQFGFIAKLKN